MPSDDPKNFSLAKFGKREVSNFMGHEMIYDLITHSLDPERTQAIEEFVASSKEAQQDMMKMLNGIQYAERLSETVVSEMILSQISEPATYLAVLLKKTKFQHWPTSVKWALEALVVVSVIIVISLAIPWDRVSKFNPFPDRKETVLAEIDKTQQVGDPAKLKNLELSEPAEFSDEEKTENIIPKKSGKRGAEAPKDTTYSAAEKEAPAVIVAGVTPAPTEVPANPSGPATKSPLKAEKPPAKTASESDLAGNKKPGEGAIYRGTLDVTNLDVVGPKIAEKVAQLGGRKAGEVDLGWQKTPGQAYFHFTLPEAKYEELLQFLATYGPPKIKKEKHPRVMPDGIVRLIVTIVEAKK